MLIIVQFGRTVRKCLLDPYSIPVRTSEMSAILAPLDTGPYTSIVYVLVKHARLVDVKYLQNVKNKKKGGGLETCN
jgi:hypothetical protein